MTIGIEQFRNPEELRLDRMLLQRRANKSLCRLRQPQDEWLGSRRGALALAHVWRGRVGRKPV
jgi:hypothetical protein